jgi:hypothetical protein
VPKADIPKLVRAEIDRRNADARKDKTNIPRAEGTSSAVNTNSIEYWEQRVAHEGEDGYPDMSAGDWATYKGLRRMHGYS